MLAELRALAAKNQVWKSFIGMGYSDCFTPPVIQRNILENPGWYTPYTAYQAEISQGRLEALLNFQTMVADLTGLPIANASLLDEATAAAEAMHMLHALAPATADADRGGMFLVDEACHPQTIEVVRTRARPLGIEVKVGDPAAFDFAAGKAFGILLQYPATDGALARLPRAHAQAHEAGTLVAMATDLLALTVLTRRARLAPTSPSAARSDSACRSATAARTRRSSPPAPSGRASCPAGSSASPRTRTATARCGWRCRRASSTSAARRRRATSARRRCSWP